MEAPLGDVAGPSAGHVALDNWITTLDRKFERTKKAIERRKKLGIDYSRLDSDFTEIKNRLRRAGLMKLHLLERDRRRDEENLRDRRPEERDPHEEDVSQGEDRGGGTQSHDDELPPEETHE